MNAQRGKTRFADKDGLSSETGRTAFLFSLIPFPVFTRERKTGVQFGGEKRLLAD